MDRFRVISGQTKRLLVIIAVYAVASTLGYFLAYELRFDFEVPANFLAQRDTNFFWVLALKFLCLWQAGQFRSIMRFFRLVDAMRLLAAFFMVGLILLFFWYCLGGDVVAPRSVILTDFLLSFLMVATFRTSLRLRSSGAWFVWHSARDLKDVIIVGAGSHGANLCAELLSSPRSNFSPVAFVDDDTHLLGGTIHGVLVAGAVHQLPGVAKAHGVNEVIIAAPHISIKQIREIIRLAEHAELSVQRVIKSGTQVTPSGTLNEIRPVECEDLLGRDPVAVDQASIAEFVRGRVILITGAGGSIGSELVQQIVSHQPSRLICIDQSELAIFELQKTLARLDATLVSCVDARVLNIRDLSRMQQLLQRFKPSIIFHAAAHKHVGLMEGQPAEALRNNFFATTDLAELASVCETPRFVLISTDKAIKPVSVMGASKRLAELAIQSRQNAPSNRTKFAIVRFGNVMGSSGSVIPVFREQIAAGGPLTVSHPDATRYFMLQSEAVGLVLESAAKSQGGETFVLDMGEPVRILELAQQMIRLQRLKLGFDIDIKFTGLLLGEKISEAIVSAGERLQPTSNSRILTYQPTEHLLPQEFKALRAQLKVATEQESASAQTIKSEMSACLDDYQVAQAEDAAG